MMLMRCVWAPPKTTESTNYKQTIWKFICRVNGNGFITFSSEWSFSLSLSYSLDEVHFHINLTKRIELVCDSRERKSFIFLLFKNNKSFNYICAYAINRINCDDKWLDMRHTTQGNANMKNRNTQIEAKSIENAIEAICVCAVYCHQNNIIAI